TAIYPGCKGTRLILFLSRRQERPLVLISMQLRQRPSLRPHSALYNFTICDAGSPPTGDEVQTTRARCVRQGRATAAAPGRLVATPRGGELRPYRSRNSAHTWPIYGKQFAETNPPHIPS